MNLILSFEVNNTIKLNGGRMSTIAPLSNGIFRKETWDFLYLTTKTLRNIYSAGQEYVTYISTHYAAHKAFAYFAETYNKIANPLELTQFLAIPLVHRNVVSLYTQIKKSVNHEDIHKKLYHAIKAVERIGDIINDVMAVIGGVIVLDTLFQLSEKGLEAAMSALKTVMQYANIIGYVSGAFATVCLIIDARRIYKSTEFLNHFTENSGYREDANYTFDDYKKLQIYLGEADDQKHDKHLTRYFKLSPNVMHRTVEQLRPKSNEILTEDEKVKLHRLFIRLKERAESMRLISIMSLVADVVAVVAGFLISAQGVGMGLLACFATYKFIEHVYTQLTAYAFEKEMDQLVDPNIKELHGWEKIRDFARWVFADPQQANQP